MADLRNFEKTLRELTAFTALPIEDSRDRAGIIQAFEFTFEQSWKGIQKVAAEQGVTLGNPKAAYSYAMQNGWIHCDEEALWLNLLKDRNLTTHTYDEGLAQEVLERILRDYLPLFTKLLAGLHSA